MLAHLGTAAGAVTPTQSRNIVINVLIIVVVLAVVLPLYGRWRRSVSARRRARWAAEEQVARPGQPGQEPGQTVEAADEARPTDEAGPGHTDGADPTGSR